MMMMTMRLILRMP